MMDQDREPWQGFMIILRKLGSQADLELRPFTAALPITMNLFQSQLRLSIVGIISVT